MNIVALYPCPYDNQIRHDYNASIVTESGIFAYEEGKLTSLKSEGSQILSERSLLFGLKELNILPSEIDKIVLPIPSIDPDFKLEKHLYWNVFKMNKPNDNDFLIWKNKIFTYLPHHLGHIALAVHSSPFENAAYLSLDGGGDWGDSRNFVFGEYNFGKYKDIYSDFGLETIASFHAFVTDAIGFSGDNGKTSGLAGYGQVKPELFAKLESLLSNENNSIFFHRERYFRSDVRLEKLDSTGYDRNKVLNSSPSSTNVLNLSLEYLPQDIAATGEKILQTKILSLLKVLKQATNQENLVLTGGLFQNVALNSAILESRLFKSVFVPMAPSDAGLSLGFALYESCKSKSEVDTNILSASTILTPYLGPSFSECEVEKFLIDQRINYTEIENPDVEAANAIANGKVVGWFQGRAEFGPRSLGARSILADPRLFDSKSRVNLLLKKRDWFMPYAPSVLEEYSHEWLEDNFFSPYMQFALKIKREKIKEIPAAVHVDGTSRIHSVRREWNPLYWSLIDNFRQLTGIPLVLNTSFNRHGIATISNPRQAIEHLLDGRIDILFIEKFKVNLVDNRILPGVQNQDFKNEELLLMEMCHNRQIIVEKFGNKEQVIHYKNELANLSQQLSAFSFKET